MTCIKFATAHPSERPALGALDALNHLLAWLLPPLALGALSAALAKLVWRGELRAVRWRRLAGWASGAAWLASAAGLVVFGRDGHMATYGAMVVASALALMATGFGFGSGSRSSGGGGR